MRLRDMRDLERSVSEHEADGLKWGTESHDLMRDVIPKVDVFIDVGANVGGFTQALLEWQPMASGVLLEPSIPVFNALRNRFRDNERIQCINAAAGKEPRDSILWNSVNYIGAGSMAKEMHQEGDMNAFLDKIIGNWEELQGVPQETRIIRLDDLQVPRVGLIKVDVEGFEYEVLPGAMSIIREDRPVIIIEISYGRKRHPRWDDEKDAINSVLELGYTLNLMPGPVPLSGMDDPTLDNQVDAVLLPEP